jgi:hypothetical protein
VLVILLAVATPIGILALSLPPDRSFLLPRNMIASLPALALLAGWLIASLGRVAAIAAATVLLLALASGAAAALEHGNRRSPYRDAAHWVYARARPGDPVIQHFFLFDKGPLGDVLTINFARPHPLFHGGGSTEEAAWERGLRSGRVFVVLPLPGYFKPVRHMDGRSGPGDRFELRDEQRYAGLEDILVGEYRLRDR